MIGSHFWLKGEPSRTRLQTPINITDAQGQGQIQLSDMLGRLVFLEASVSGKCPDSIAPSEGSRLTRGKCLMNSQKKSLFNTWRSWSLLCLLTHHCP